MNLSYLFDAIKAISSAFLTAPTGPNYWVGINLSVNVRYPGNTESVTLDSKRRDVAGFAQRLNDMRASMDVAARAAGDAGDVTDAEAGIVTVK
jgi:hypothetical protein